MKNASRNMANMSDKKIFLVLIEDLPCPGSHYLHTKKFLNGFKELGFEYVEINLVDQISQISENDIVYVSNHGLDDLDRALPVIEALGKRKAQYILWFWHQHLDIAKQYFGERFVLTGEHFHHKPVLDSYQSTWNKQQGLENYVPLTFASKLLPSQVGNLKREDRYLAHFVGANYKKSWNRRLQLRYRNVKIVNTPPFIGEAERESIFLSSGIALGWHSDSNIQNHVVVERVFEGLSYGNFVISDHPTAREITDGIVEVAETHAELVHWVKRYRDDAKFRIDKQTAGYAWAKSNGTYTNVAGKFALKFLELDGN